MAQVSGTLRGFDIFLNLVLHDASDDTIPSDKKPMGTVVRQRGCATSCILPWNNPHRSSVATLSSPSKLWKLYDDERTLACVTLEETAACHCTISHASLRPAMNGTTRSPSYSQVALTCSSPLTRRSFTSPAPGTPYHLLPNPLTKSGSLSSGIFGSSPSASKSVATRGSK